MTVPRNFARGLTSPRLMQRFDKCRAESRRLRTRMPRHGCVGSRAGGRASADERAKKLFGSAELRMWRQIAQFLKLIACLFGDLGERAGNAGRARRIAVLRVVATCRNCDSWIEPHGLPAIEKR
jgi:hypothetical protein